MPRRKKIIKEGSVGALRLELCLSTLEACCQLQHGQMLQVSGTAKKQGSGLTNSEDIQFDVMKTDEECICLELKASGMGKVFRQRLSQTWHCTLTKAQLTTSDLQHDQIPRNEQIKPENSLTTCISGYEGLEYLNNQSICTSDHADSMNEDPDSGNDHSISENYSISMNNHTISANDQLISENGQLSPSKQDENLGLENLPLLLDHVKEEVDDESENVRFDADVCDERAKEEEDTSMIYDLDTVAADTMVGADNECSIGADDVDHDKVMTLLKVNEHEGTDSDEYPFPCSMCSRAFETKNGLVQHQNKMHKHPGSKSQKYNDEYPFPCSMCSRGFETKNGLAQHQNKMHKHPGSKSQKYICRFCHKSFHRSRNPSKALFSHEARVCRKNPGSNANMTVRHLPSDEYPHACSMCSEAFKTETGLTQHQNRIHKCKEQSNTKLDIGALGMMVCSICGKYCLSERAFRLHRTQQHGITEPPKKRIVTESVDLVCPHCDETFNTRVTYRQHIRYKCLKNPAAVKCSYCNICLRPFPSDQLDAHKAKKHKEIIPKVCELCGTEFTSRNGLYIHKRRVHNSRPPQWHCQPCKKSYQFKFLLDIHLTAHSDEKKIQCSVCGKLFKNRDQEIKHRRRVHENVYPHRCKKCGHGMSMKSNLDTHQCGRVRRSRDNNETALVTKQGKSVDGPGRANDSLFTGINGCINNGELEMATADVSKPGLQQQAVSGSIVSQQNVEQLDSMVAYEQTHWHLPEHMVTSCNYQ